MSEDEATRFLASVRRLTGAFTEMGHRFGEQHGLSRSDVSALIVVTEVTEQGSDIGTVELARRIGLSAPSATVLVDRLVAAGLLARHRHPGDARRVVLSLTPAGRAAGGEHFGVLNRRLLEMLRARPTADLRAAADLLDRAADVTATVLDPTPAADRDSLSRGPG